MSNGDGLDDAVRVVGVLVVVMAHPLVPVFGLVDCDPVPDFGLAVLKAGPPFLLDAGVGEADVDGVIEVQPLPVPGRDDRLRGDVGVVAVFDRAFDGRQGRAGGDGGAVEPVEGEGAVAGGGDQVAAVVDEHVVVL